MPKFTVYLAREITKMYEIVVEANDRGEAEEKAWKEYLAGYSNIIDNGYEVNENEYIDFVEEKEEQDAEV